MANITYAVTALSQYLQNPGHTHWEQAKQVIHYLKGTHDYELKYGPSGGVEGFTNANWGNDINDRHSICGYPFVLNGGAISWSSKKQSVVALSSIEAEYIAVTHAAKEATWIRHLLSEIYSPLVRLWVRQCDQVARGELSRRFKFRNFASGRTSSTTQMRRVPAS